MSDQTNNNLAGVFNEIMGAQFATEFIQKAWDAASPEARKKIADALLARVEEMIRRDDWAVRSALEQTVAGVVRGEAEKILAPMRPDIAKRIGERIAGDIERSMDAMIGVELKDVRKAVGDRMVSVIQDWRFK